MWAKRVCPSKQFINYENQPEVKVTRTPFEGLLIIEPGVYKDSRGYFYESYNRKSFQAAGIDFEFVQDNQSYSVKNVIRGLHFQQSPYAQTKLVRVLEGTILDVAVDLRRDQPTFGKSFTFELSSQNKLQLLIPKGFAHGFSVLSDAAEIHYKCDEYYAPECARGILYRDADLSIDWKVRKNDEIISDNDLLLPAMNQITFL